MYIYLFDFLTPNMSKGRLKIKTLYHLPLWIYQYSMKCICYAPWYGMCMTESSNINKKDRSRYRHHLCCLNPT